MANKKIGFEYCMRMIGENFFELHKNQAVFSYGETDRGFHCFLGISMKEYPEEISYLSNRDKKPFCDWDYYVSCYVIDGKAVGDMCRVLGK